MNSESIVKIQQLSSQIENFNECYKYNVLYGSVDGDVTSEALLAYLIEHPELSSIAADIDNLQAKLGIKG
jgi:hypothetical protein